MTKVVVAVILELQGTGSFPMDLLLELKQPVEVYTFVEIQVLWVCTGMTVSSRHFHLESIDVKYLIQMEPYK